MMPQTVTIFCRLFVLSVTGLLCSIYVAAPAQSAPAGWNLVWSDEFDGPDLDTSKWDPITWTTPFNNERQAYLPAQVTLENGNLALTATDEPYGGKHYRSGKVESKYAQQYGRWEIRAKLPGTRGTWPAIWLLPDTSLYAWPTQGEIDIMENRGNQPLLTSSAFHYRPSGGGHQYVVDENQMNNNGQPENYHDEFHNYAVEWDSDKLRFFVDDVNYYTVYDDQVGGFISNQTAPMELNLNVAVGGDFLGSAQPDDTSSWPQQILIDYVRVFQRDANPPQAILENGSFEEQGGSLANWSTFGNEGPNVGAQIEAALDGTHALKLFGQFSGAANVSGVSQGITVSGGDSISATVNSYIRSSDSITGTDNRVELTIDYYNEFGARYGSNKYLGSKRITIADGSTANDAWADHQLTDTVPAGAVEARLGIVFVQPDNQGGAVHVDDVHFINTSHAARSDFNLDGKVDGADLSAWQAGFGTSSASRSDGDANGDGHVDGQDFLIWQQETIDAAAALSLLNGLPAGLLVPEPSTGLLSVLAVVFSSLRALQSTTY